MTILRNASAAGALLLASVSACAAHAPTPRIAPLPGSGGAWVYDGRTPPSCDARDVRVRHFEGDGHPDAHAGHAHLGHGHRWAGRNHKGQPTKPPCYVRRSSELSRFPAAGRTAAIRHALPGDLS